MNIRPGRRRTRRSKGGRGEQRRGKCSVRMTKVVDKETEVMREASKMR